MRSLASQLTIASARVFRIPTQVVTIAKNWPGLAGLKINIHGVYMMSEALKRVLNGVRVSRDNELKVNGVAIDRNFHPLFAP